MLEARMYVNNIGYTAKRDYIYRLDVITGRPTRHRLSADDKAAIKDFERDPYNELATWEFLEKIFYNELFLDESFFDKDF